LLMIEEKLFWALEELDKAWDLLRYIQIQKVLRISMDFSGLWTPNRPNLSNRVAKPPDSSLLHILVK
jgi:hypothetical protein